MAVPTTALAPAAEHPRTSINNTTIRCLTRCLYLLAVPTPTLTRQTRTTLTTTWVGSVVLDLPRHGVGPVSGIGCGTSLIVSSGVASSSTGPFATRAALMRAFTYFGERSIASW